MRASAVMRTSAVMRALLLVVLPISASYACSGALRNELAADDAKLTACRNEGRSALDAGHTQLFAYDRYCECTAREGLRTAPCQEARRP